MIQRLTRYYSTQRSKKILSIAMPAALNSLLDILNLTIDLLMIGSISSEAIVAVGVSTNYIMLVFAFTSIIFVGNTALVARFIGANSRSEASEVALNNTLLALAIGLPLVIIAYLFYENYFVWMDISTKAKELGSVYLDITILAIPFILVKQVAVSAFSACGDTKTPFMIKIFITFVNVVLKYCLIFGFWFIPALGVLGAAISSLAINILETLLIFFLLIFKKDSIGLIGRINLDYIWRTLKIGFPTGCERLFTFIAIIIMSKFVASYGTSILAGYQIGSRIEGFSFMPGFGFMIAAMALVGQSLGAKKPLQARFYVLNTIILGSIFMGIMGIIMIVCPYLISSFFSDDAIAISASADYLIPLGISQIPLAIIFILDGALRGAGVTKITLAINAIMIWGFRVLPCFFIYYYQAPFWWIFVCISGETFLRAYVFWRVFANGRWRFAKI